jgi:hypothetical protein
VMRVFVEVYGCILRDEPRRACAQKQFAFVVSLPSRTKLSIVSC